jgi:hypothetical protein
MALRYHASYAEASGLLSASFDRAATFSQKQASSSPGSSTLWVIADPPPESLFLHHFSLIT